MTSEVIRVEPREWLEQVDTRSIVSADVAIQRPLSEMVETTILAVGGSLHTTRSYTTGIGLFLEYLGMLYGDRIPGDWRPLAARTEIPTADKKRTKTVWEYRGFAAVLRLVSAGALDGFERYLAELALSRSTIDLRRSAAVTFLKVCLRDGVITQEQGVALGIKPFKKRRRRDVKPVGRRLGVDEVRGLRAAVDMSTLKGKRDLAILDLMLYAGLRREEVAHLDLDHLRRDNGRLWLILEGKGSKTRRIKVHDALYKSLQVWIDAIDLEIPGEGQVFRTVDRWGKLGDRFHASVIGRLVAEYGAAADLAPRDGDQRLSPHDLRRTCARNAYDNGAGLIQVQQFLGHSDPKTTAGYIGAYERDDDTAVDYVRY